MKYLSQFLLILILVGCSSQISREDILLPKEIIDLGALVTEDLPEMVWGKAFMNQMGFEENNTFEVIDWEVEFSDGIVSGSNSYYTIFNHGGPHIDAPNHMDLGKGLDSYPLEAFIGTLKVIDVSKFPFGRSVGIEEIGKYEINPGEILLIYTAYKPPQGNDLPQRVALTQEAAEYLANLPVRAFGTDAFNVESDDNPTPVTSELAVQRVAPVHYAFLTRGIPIFEQPFNVDKLLGKQEMQFVGPPLNIRDADRMIVRPVVLVYD